jgi:hypothetical protein
MLRLVPDISGENAYPEKLRDLMISRRSATYSSMIHGFFRARQFRWRLILTRARFSGGFMPQRLSGEFCGLLRWINALGKRKRPQRRGCAETVSVRGDAPAAVGALRDARPMARQLKLIRFRDAAATRRMNPRCQARQ